MRRVLLADDNKMDGDRETAFEAGMNDYLTKPLRVEVIRDALVRWIGAPLDVAR